MAAACFIQAPGNAVRLSQQKLIDLYPRYPDVPRVSQRAGKAVEGLLGEEHSGGSQRFLSTICNPALFETGLSSTFLTLLAQTSYSG